MIHAVGRLAAVVLALTAALLAAFVALASPAAAHAELVGTTPAEGERLEHAPQQVTLEFTEQVTLIVGGIELLDERGELVRTTDPHVKGRQVVLPLPDDLPRGGYVVSWRVVSADTHPVAGAFTFGVAAPPVSAAAVGAADAGRQPAVAVTVAVCRWLGFAGMALLIGGTVFSPRAGRPVWSSPGRAASCSPVGGEWLPSPRWSGSSFTAPTSRARPCHPRSSRSCSVRP